MVVDAFELDAVKTGTFRKTLGKTGCWQTTLLVDGSKENRNLELSSRNIRGVELNWPATTFTRITCCAMKRRSSPSRLWKSCRIR